MDEIAPPPENYASIHDVPTAKLAHNFVGTLILCKGNLNQYDAMAAMLIRKLRGEINPASTSFPYLAIAQAFNVSHGLVLEVVDLIEAGKTVPFLYRSQHDRTSPELVDKVRAAVEREHKRREEVNGQTATESPQNPGGASPAVG